MKKTKMKLSKLKTSIYYILEDNSITEVEGIVCDIEDGIFTRDNRLMYIDNNVFCYETNYYINKQFAEKALESQRQENRAYYKRQSAYYQRLLKELDK